MRAVITLLGCVALLALGAAAICIVTDGIDAWSARRRKEAGK